MNEQEIIEKVRQYLKKEGIIPDEGTLSYSGIREKSPLFDRSGTKPMHIVTYSIELIKDSPTTIDVGFVTVDVETGKLEYLVSGSTLKKIDS